MVSIIRTDSTYTQPRSPQPRSTNFEPAIIRDEREGPAGAQARRVVRTSAAGAVSTSEGACLSAYASLDVYSIARLHPVTQEAGVCEFVRACIHGWCAQGR